MTTVSLPADLEENERVGITQLARALAAELGDNLRALYLFGSKARGDFHADSDIDLLIVVRELGANSRWLIRMTAADHSLEYDVLFNTHLYEEKRWDMIVVHDDTLWREVRRDGIQLPTFMPQPTE